MKKKILSLGLAALVGTSTILIPINSKAVSANTELEKKKENIQNERSGVDTSIQDKKGEISDLEKKQKNLEAEIKLLDSKMTETNEQLRQRQGEIDEAKKKIDDLKAQIKEVKERIEKRNLLLKDRVRSLQESGGMVSYLDVLLGAQDFGDFVSRINAVTTIVKADQDIIKAHEEDIKLLEKSEAELNSELAKLASALTELESLKQQLNLQIAEKNKIMEQVIADHDAAENELYKLEDEATFLAEQEAAIQKEMTRQQEIEEAESKQSSSVSSTSAASESARETVPAITSGSFMWPAKGTFTSGYGPRWGKLHGGIDIANRADNVPIVASAGGTVIRSYYSSSYGNAVFISHNIDGKVYTTVYAHMDSRLVSSGQTVSKGQQIGYMGNTGQSTGKHLHFEIHDGAWKNPVNPSKYLP